MALGRILSRRGAMTGVAGAVLAAASASGQTGEQDGRSVSSRTRERALPKKIGLIGGLAQRAGVFYYDQILQRFAGRDEPLQLVLGHADVKKVLAFVGAGDRAGLGQYLGGMANELAAAGASVVAITAVAPHLAITELVQVARVPVANVLETIAAGLDQRGLDRVAVFGNRAVMRTDIFGAVRPDRVVKMQPAVLESVHDLYNDIAIKGKRGNQPEFDTLDKTARDLIAQGAQAIVLAGTDLSSFYAERKPDYPFLDVAQLHIDQIMAA